MSLAENGATLAPINTLEDLSNTVGNITFPGSIELKNNSSKDENGQIPEIDNVPKADSTYGWIIVVTGFFLFCNTFGVMTVAVLFPG
ncbi:hypothetical protein AYI68_g3671 [Smittium mucronatum]|uniref:Uncharacterized protein n=1 Tax=Smittium mucronatum TaxID=133383 RepID=A0A1R0GZ69_9FUNG|nr:hypothetical protein AYI68_g3671 [Smittium mucronatum]